MARFASFQKIQPKPKIPSKERINHLKDVLSESVKNGSIATKSSNEERENQIKVAEQDIISFGGKEELFQGLKRDNAAFHFHDKIHKKIKRTTFSTVVHNMNDHNFKFCSRRFILMPSDTLRKLLDYIIGLSLTYLFLAVPLEIGFQGIPSAEINSNISLVLDVIMLINIFANFRTAYFDEKLDIYETNPKKIAKRYIQFWFWIDIISTIPLELFFKFSQTSSRKWIKYIKFSKIPKLFRITYLLRYNGKFGQYWYTSLKTFIIFSMILHFYCCAIALPLFSHNYFPLSISEWNDSNLTNLYTYSFRTSFEILSGTTTKEFPVNAQIHLILGQIFGGLLFAYIQAHIFSLVYMKKKAKLDHYFKVERVLNELKTLSVSHHTTTEVKKYYDYIWKEQLIQNYGLVYSDETLSYNLRKKVALESNKSVLMKCTLFRGLSDDCVANVLMKMGRNVYINQEPVVFRGDHSSFVYLVTKGCVNLLSSLDDKAIRQTLYPGSTFGEISFLSILPQQRNTIISNGNSEIWNFHKKDFEEIVVYYPTLKTNLTRLALLRATDNKEELQNNRKKCNPIKE